MAQSECIYKLKDLIETAYPGPNFSTDINYLFKAICDSYKNHAPAVESAPNDIQMEAINKAASGVPIAIDLAGCHPCHDTAITITNYEYKDIRIFNSVDPWWDEISAVNAERDKAMKLPAVNLPELTKDMTIVDYLGLLNESVNYKIPFESPEMLEVYFSLAILIMSKRPNVPIILEQILNAAFFKWLDKYINQGEFSGERDFYVMFKDETIDTCTLDNGIITFRWGETTELRSNQYIFIPQCICGAIDITNDPRCSLLSESIIFILNNYMTKRTNTLMNLLIKENLIQNANG